MFSQCSSLHVWLFYSQCLVSVASSYLALLTAFPVFSVASHTWLCLLNLYAVNLHWLHSQCLVSVGVSYMFLSVLPMFSVTTHTWPCLLKTYMLSISWLHSQCLVKCQFLAWPCVALYLALLCSQCLVLHLIPGCAFWKLICCQSPLTAFPVFSRCLVSVHLFMSGSSIPSV